MCVDNLNDLLEKPFKTFTKEEQLQIVKKGRFTDLANLSQNDRGKYRMFSVSWYQRVKWLTGNAVNRKLYCWNCVLFPSGQSKLWNSTGFDDLKNLSHGTKKHEESKEHTYSTVKLKLLCKNKKSDENDIDAVETNLKVKRNREYLERLIDIASTLAHLEIPFRKEDDDDASYKCFLNIFRKYDDIVRTQLEQGSVFKGLTKTVQVDLVQAIAHVMRQRIVEEVAAANFFALEVDEVNCNPCSRQISIIIRYVKDGRVVERFIGLFDVSYGKKSEDLLAVLDRELEKFNYKEKMIAQCYDGGVVKCTELYNLQQAVKKQQGIYSRAQFVHCYAHEFNTILGQSLRSVQECKLFFSVISLFGSFFKKIKIKDVLPNVAPTWFESIPLCVMTIKSNYDTIEKVLEFITTTEKFENALDTISHAVNLLNHLKSFKFMVFLTMFNEFFGLIELFFVSVPIDSRFYRDELKALTDKLRAYKTDVQFKQMIQNIPGASSSIVNVLFSLYLQIIENIIYEIEGRFLDIELADFFGLLNFENIKTYHSTRKPPDVSFITSLKENYANLFDTMRLRNELDLFYSDPSIGGIGESDVKRTSDILRFIHDNDIKSCVPEFVKLLELIVTIPSLAEPLEGSLCALTRVKTYCSSEKKEEPRSALALLAIEKDFLFELEKSNQWYAQIIDYFATLPSTSCIDLTLKNCELPGEPKVESIGEPELMIKSENDLF